MIHHARLEYMLTAVKMAASMCRKPKQVVLSLENKLSILDSLAKGEKATEFGIGNSMVTDLKKESKIRLFISSMESLSVCSKERKIIFADDDKVVHKFISENFTYLK